MTQCRWMREELVDERSFPSPAAYRKATMSIVRGGAQSSAVPLPVFDASTVDGH